MYHNRLVAGGSGISSGFKYIPPHMPNKATNGASKVSPAVNTVNQSNYSDEFDLIDFYD